MKTLFIILSFLLLSTVSTVAQQWSVVAEGNYITRGKVYPYPTVKEYDIRNFSYAEDHHFSPSLTLRFQLSKSMTASLRAEFLSDKNSRKMTVASIGKTMLVDAEESIIMIPLELIMLYRLPFSSSDIDFQLFGGIGFYPAMVNRTIGTITSTTQSFDDFINILAGIGMEYYLSSDFSLTWKMIFRDAQSLVTSSFSASEGIYNGVPVTLGKRDFDTRLQMYGTLFSAGVAWHW